MAYQITFKAYSKLWLHGAKYSTSAIGGILIGSKNDRKVTDVIPLVHSILLPTPSIQAALEQIQLYCKSKGLAVLGLYVGNEANVDISLHPAVELFANQIDQDLGGGSLIIRLHPASLSSEKLGVVFYFNDNGIWKDTSAPRIENQSNATMMLQTLLKDGAYRLVYDLESHLVQIQENWLENSELDKLLANKNLGFVTSMKIAIFGATGKTGLELVKQSIEKNHQVTLLSRTIPPKGIEQNEHITIVQGDATNPDDIDKVVQGCDTCIVSLGSRPGGPPICSTAQPLINNSCEKFGVKKMVVVTSMGVGESYDDMNWLTTALVWTLLKKPIADKNIQEDIVKKSNLDWTIVRPGGLKDASVSGRYQFLERGLGGGRVSRSNVAHLIINNFLVPNEYSRKCYTVVE